MASESWTDLEAKLAETFRKWSDVTEYQLTTYALTLRGRERARFWLRRTGYSEEERAVMVRFRWSTRRREQPYQWIELTAKSAETPIDNLALLYTALETIRLTARRGATLAVVNLYRQMYPVPVTHTYTYQTGGGTQANQGPHTQTPPPGSPYAVLHISPNAPLAVAEAAYRALAREAHPDAGGNHERMKALNAAIEAIRAGQRSRAS